MRIVDLHVEGFGVWTDLHESELAELSVFYGPNEAGKTTLMQFVRSMFYGFTAQRRARYLPPLAGGSAGGRLSLVENDRTFTLTRLADPAPNVPESLSVSDAQEVLPPEPTLKSLLGGVDEAIYTNIFAFGLKEIQELATLGDSQVADELYALALGLDRVSLVDVLNELEASRNRLLATDERPSQITQLLSQRERLHIEIDELGHSTARYLSAVAQRERLSGEIASLEQELAQLEKHAAELALARSLGERWQRRASIDGQLALLAGADTLPEQALARFEQLQARLTTCLGRLRRVKRRRRRLRLEMNKLAINESLVRHAMRWEALGEQQPWIQALQAEIAQLEERAFDLESQLEASGAPSKSAAAHKGQLSKHQFDELRSAARALRAARDEEREFATDTGSTTSGAEAARQIEAALGPAKDKGLTRALAEAGDLVSQLRKRVQLDERIDQMSRREADLDEQSQQAFENQMLPTWALAGLGALFVLGCALVLLFVAGLVLPASLSGALGWPIGAVGVLAAGAAGAIKFAMDRSAVGQLDGCQQQIQNLKDQLKQARADRDQLDAQLPRGGGPLVSRLQTAEKSLAQLEALVPLEARREALDRDAAQQAARIESLVAKRKAAHKRWCRLLIEAGLPAKTRPRELKHLARGQAQRQGVYASLDEARQLLARRRAEHETIVARIRQLVAEAGLTPRSQQPLDQLRQGLAELAEHMKLQKQREGLSRRRARLRDKQEPLAALAKRLTSRRARLLRLSGAASEADFLRLAQSQAEAQRLRSERARLSQEINAAAAGRFSEEQLAHWHTSQNLEQLEATIVESRTALHARLTAASEQRGALGQQINTLAEDRQLANKHLELGLVEQRLADALDRWRVLAVCNLFLSAVRDFYEREHQPEALREASAYLRRLTAGRYPRIWTPLGQHLLKVDDKHGHSLTVEVLSSGTREQLFLALRLALVNSYARRGIRLPLVLDDVLVNFDVGRAKAAAMVLRDFARHGQQVLVFTCHEHIARLFRQVKADVRLLGDHEGLQTALVEESPKRLRRARPEPEPEPAEPAVAEPVVVVEPPKVIAPEPEPEPEWAPEDWTLVSLAVPAAAVEVVEAPSAILVESALAPAAVVLEADPPRPAPSIVPARPLRPARLPKRRIVRHVARVDWSAEEFAGELADRVRRTEVVDFRESELHSEFDDGFHSITEAA